MKKNLCLFLFILIAAVAHAQKDSTSNQQNEVFTSTMVTAKFPGGIDGWNKYLQKNLKAELGAQYIKIKRKQKEVKQIAIVSFLVDTSGNIFEVQCVNADEVHPKLAEEAIRVIKEGPRWVPAEINGKKVIYRQKQSITWVVQQE